MLTSIGQHIEGAHGTGGRHDNGAASVQSVLFHGGYSWNSGKEMYMTENER